MNECWVRRVIVCARSRAWRRWAAGAFGNGGLGGGASDDERTVVARAAASSSSRSRKSRPASSDRNACAWPPLRRVSVVKVDDEDVVDRDDRVVAVRYGDGPDAIVGGGAGKRMLERVVEPDVDR